MGKVLVIKGADFYENAVPTEKRTILALYESLSDARVDCDASGGGTGKLVTLVGTSSLVYKITAGTKIVIRDTYGYHSEAVVHPAGCRYGFYVNSPVVGGAEAASNFNFISSAVFNESDNLEYIIPYTVEVDGYLVVSIAGNTSQISAIVESISFQ